MRLCPSGPHFGGVMDVGRVAPEGEPSCSHKGPQQIPWGVPEPDCPKGRIGSQVSLGMAVPKKGITLSEETIFI